MFNNIKTKKIIDSIKGIELLKGTSLTQQNSNIHETTILDIFVEKGATLITKEVFRKCFNKLTSKNFKDSNYEFNNSIDKDKNKDKDIDSILETANITYNKSYIVHQPNGSQNFPDFVLFKLDKVSNESNFILNFNCTSIECKTKIPKFNNNPPKKNKNCIYICGNALFNGYLLRSDENIRKYNEFQDKYRELINSINSDPDYDMHHIQYKVTEFNGKDKQWPPKYFIGKEKENELINCEKISYYMN